MANSRLGDWLKLSFKLQGEKLVISSEGKLVAEFKLPRSWPGAFCLIPGNLLSSAKTLNLDIADIAIKK